MLESKISLLHLENQHFDFSTIRHVLDDISVRRHTQKNKHTTASVQVVERDLGVKTLDYEDSDKLWNAERDHAYEVVVTTAKNTSFSSVVQYHDDASRIAALRSVNPCTTDVLSGTQAPPQPKVVFQDNTTKQTYNEVPKPATTHQAEDIEVKQLQKLEALARWRQQLRNEGYL